MENPLAPLQGKPNPLQQPQAPQPLPTEMKTRWNKFIDYVAAQKMLNHPSLDKRNMNVGMGLIQKFNKENPNDTLPLDIVPKVQSDLQDYRKNLVNNWKAGKAQIDGVKTENDIMPEISPVDGWPGSKTLSHKFPIATLTTTTPAGTTFRNFGTDMDAYAKIMGRK